MTGQDATLAQGRSLVVHGPLSDRVYLARLAAEDAPAIVARLDGLAAEHGYGKIFAKVPESLTAPFFEAGYVTEALVPGMYPPAQGTERESGHFMARFPDPARQRESDPEKALAVLRLAGKKAQEPGPPPLPDGWSLERLGQADAGEMARLYDKAFSTYPFPINDPGYLRRGMASHMRHYGVRVRGRLVALSGCETEPENGLAEMTDFGSLPEARGNGAAYHLLDRMERDMAADGYRLAYTISRAHSAPINVSFARRGYAFAGTLLANTNISGSLESMNIWFKTLQ